MCVAKLVDIFFRCRQAIAPLQQGWWGRYQGGGKASGILVLFLPPHFLPGKHVLGHALDWLVDLNWREREACWCWVAISLGQDRNPVGNRRSVHLVSCRSASVPWQGILDRHVYQLRVHHQFGASTYRTRPSVIAKLTICIWSVIVCEQTYGG